LRSFWARLRNSFLWGREIPFGAQDAKKQISSHLGWGKRRPN
jgi:hypothetical protein